MDINVIKKKINQDIGDVILDIGFIGKNKIPLLWIEISKIREVCKILRNFLNPSFDYLYDMNVFQVDDVLVVNYLFSSVKNYLFIRGSLVLKYADNNIFPSIKDIYPSESFEDEAFEFFGINFGDNKRKILLNKFKGYPLRKDFDGN